MKNLSIEELRAMDYPPVLEIVAIAHCLAEKILESPPPIETSQE